MRPPPTAGPAAPPAPGPSLQGHRLPLRPAPPPVTAAAAAAAEGAGRGEGGGGKGMRVSGIAGVYTQYFTFPVPAGSK